MSKLFPHSLYRKISVASKFNLTEFSLVWKENIMARELFMLNTFDVCQWNSSFLKAGYQECFGVPWFFLCKSWPLSGSCGHKNLRWFHRVLVPWVDLSQAYTCPQYLHVAIGSWPLNPVSKCFQTSDFFDPTLLLLFWTGEIEVGELVNCWSWSAAVETALTAEVDLFRFSTWDGNDALFASDNILCMAINLLILWLLSSKDIAAGTCKDCASPSRLSWNREWWHHLQC